VNLFIVPVLYLALRKGSAAQQPPAESPTAL
jgi:hypothetical protein